MAKSEDDDALEPSKRRGRAIRTLRDAKGWSQQRLIDAVQAANGGKRVLTKAYLSKIENGARNVGSEILDAILAALEVADDALSSRRATEIERDPTAFMVRESLSSFILKDKVSDDADALRRTLDLLPRGDGPTTVAEWRGVYPILTAYHRARSRPRRHN
jgi:transcriptional regulator with XRE-family HTH domain